MKTYKLFCIAVASGTLAATLISSPVFAEPRTTPVQVTNLLGIDPNNNTVKTEQSGFWSVGIDAASNTVKSPTQHNGVMLWTADRTWEANEWFSTSPINCAGYKEARVVIWLTGYSTATDFTRLTVGAVFSSPDGINDIYTGRATFGVPAHSLTDESGFMNMDTVCSFTIPVMSDQLTLRLNNATPTEVRLSRGSWVYLVN